jgi:hypothetical protein
MRIVRYFPAFVDRFDEPEIYSEFSSLDELFSIEWVKSWANEPGFDRFSTSTTDRKYLMAEFSRPRSWSVVGFFGANYELSLPILDTKRMKDEP